MTGGRSKPDWWAVNQADREAMGLPDYEPPRFADGVYTHEVVPELESTHGCEIRFLGINVDWGDEWGVWIDRERAFTVGRSRDDNGNTVYRIDSGEFRDRIEREVG